MALWLHTSTVKNSQTVPYAKPTTTDNIQSHADIHSVHIIRYPVSGTVTSVGRILRGKYISILANTPFIRAHSTAYAGYTKMPPLPRKQSAIDFRDARRMTKSYALHDFLTVASWSWTRTYIQLNSNNGLHRQCVICGDSRKRPDTIYHLTHRRIRFSVARWKPNEYSQQLNYFLGEQIETFSIL